MSDCGSVEDMDFADGAENAQDQEPALAASTTVLNEATSTASENRCGSCNNAYDGNSSSIVSASDRGHLLCAGCYGESQEANNVYCMTPRDLLSPEPPLPSSGRGQGEVGDGKEVGHTAQVLNAQGTLATSVNNISQTKALKGQISEQPSTTASSMKTAPVPSELENVRVNCINGSKVEAKVTKNTTVQQVKREVHKETGIAMERQHLMFKGKAMNDTKPLGSYGVNNGAVLQMGTKCYGG